MPRLAAAATIPCMKSESRDSPEALRKLYELERVAEAGQDETTPLILMGEVWIVSAIVAGVIVALSLLAFHVAS
jgi:hypothetical protein